MTTPFSISGSAAPPDEDVWPESWVGAEESQVGADQSWEGSKKEGKRNFGRAIRYSGSKFYEIVFKFDNTYNSPIFRN